MERSRSTDETPIRMPQEDLLRLRSLIANKLVEMTPDRLVAILNEVREAK